MREELFAKSSSHTLFKNLYNTFLNDWRNASVVFLFVFSERARGNLFFKKGFPRNFLFYLFLLHRFAVWRDGAGPVLVVDDVSGFCGGGLFEVFYKGIIDLGMRCAVCR